MNALLTIIVVLVQYGSGIVSETNEVKVHALYEGLLPRLDSVSDGRIDLGHCTSCSSQHCGPGRVVNTENLLATFQLHRTTSLEGYPSSEDAYDARCARHAELLNLANDQLTQKFS